MSNNDSHNSIPKLESDVEDSSSGKEIDYLPDDEDSCGSMSSSLHERYNDYNSSGNENNCQEMPEPIFTNIN
jgi:hypothetical protein